MSHNLTQDRPTEGTLCLCVSVPCCFVCLSCSCFPVTDLVASGAKRRSLTSACGSRGETVFLTRQCFSLIKFVTTRAALVWCAWLTCASARVVL